MIENDQVERGPKNRWSKENERERELYKKKSRNI